MSDPKKTAQNIAEPDLPQTEWESYISNILKTDYNRHTLQHAFSILTYAAMKEKLHLFSKTVIESALQTYIRPRPILLAPLPQTAAAYGSLYQIRFCLNAEILRFRHPKERVGSRGYNAITLAAEHGNLDQIPQELLTREILFEQRHEERCPAFRAARYGYLYQVPEEFRTNVSTLLEQQNHECLFELAVQHHQLAAIPIEMAAADYRQVKEAIERCRKSMGGTNKSEAQQALSKADNWLRRAAANLIATTKNSDIDQAVIPPAIRKAS